MSREANSVAFKSQTSRHSVDNKDSNLQQQQHGNSNEKTSLTKKAREPCFLDTTTTFDPADIDHNSLEQFETKMSRMLLDGKYSQASFSTHPLFPAELLDNDFNMATCWYHSNGSPISNPCEAAIYFIDGTRIDRETM